VAPTASTRQISVRADGSASTTSTELAPGSTMSSSPCSSPNASLRPSASNAAVRTAPNVSSMRRALPVSTSRTSMRPSYVRDPHDEGRVIDLSGLAGGALDDPQLAVASRHGGVRSVGREDERGALVVV
jgi:hypothetical protein